MPHGQTTDVSTVEKVKEDLCGWRLGRCVFVGDAGMNSEENRRTLSLGGGKYILAARMRAGDEVSREVLTRAGRYQVVAENLRVEEVVIGDGERRQRYVVCSNPEEAERQAKHRGRVIEELVRELGSLRKPERRERHSRRTCQLLSTPRYARYLRQTRRGALKIDRAAVRAEEKLDGKWVVTSNDDTLSAEDLALGYTQLMRVESCCRTIKSGLRTRPVFHWRPHRVSAHVSLRVLALLVERIPEIRTAQSWRNVRALLDTIKVLEYQRGNGGVRQTTELRREVEALLRTRKVPAPPRLFGVQTASAAWQHDLFAPKQRNPASSLTDVCPSTVQACQSRVLLRR